jgi:CRISPR-associated endonuclease/helicase Cas3
LLDAAAVAGGLWDGFLSPAARWCFATGLGVDEPHARQLLMLWAGLHDVGKAIPCFQAQSEDDFAMLTGFPRSGGERIIGHAFAAHVWLGQALAKVGYSSSGPASDSYRVAQMLGGHHGRFSQIDRAMSAPLAYVPELGDGPWETQRQALTDAVFQMVGAPEPPPEMSVDVMGLACGVVVLADWLVSQEDFILNRLGEIPATGDFSALGVHFGKSVEAAPRMLEAAGLRRLRLRAGSFAEEFPFAANELQSSIETKLPGLVASGAGLLLVMAPMGEGKTEAALHAARLMGEAAGTPGIYVGLPTMATADQMYLRVGEYGARRATDAAALTLLHSMAWMNTAYQPDRRDEASDAAIISGEDDGSWMVATEWLQGAKRGLLAPLAVGTIDQALVAVLCGKHNMLRLLGLAGKVLIVDEVHAYDAFMQGLLRRLLTWLGRLGVPVVLLSATLPQLVARRLIEAYVQGAGGRVPGDYEVCYPGWSYVDGGTGQVSTVAIECKPRSLAVDMRQAPLRPDGHVERGQVLRDVLRPVVEERAGCVAVICNTVAEAQQTYRELRAWFDQISESGRTPPQLDLLHARFPAARRAQITEDVVAKYGKHGVARGSRPLTGGVLVATQVIEQSIDLDFDVMVSDLAPIALLLQRAGRCWRHGHTPRPRWASGPRLVVLSPVSAAGDPVTPAAWPLVYSASLLRRTRETLMREDAGQVQIPGDVQRLVDEVYDETFASGTLQADDIERLADEQVKSSLADMAAVPEPADLTSLYELTRTDLDEELITTRLGADSVRLLCCYTGPDGGRWLDRACTTPLPQEGTGNKGRFTRSDIKGLFGRTIPVPASWVTQRNSDNAVPETWGQSPYLRDLVLLPHPITQGGQCDPARIGGFSFELRDEEGLVRIL